MNQNQTPSQSEQPRTKSPAIAWTAPEFEEYQKHPLWFAAVALITAALVLYGVFTRSWTTAVVFGLTGVMAVVFGTQKPRTMEIKLSGLGIQLGEKMFSYRDLVKFWIIYAPPEVKVIYLETKSTLNRIVKIELADQDPVAVRNFLKGYLEEDLDQQESFIDIIARKLRF